MKLDASTTLVSEIIYGIHDGLIASMDEIFKLNLSYRRTFYIFDPTTPKLFDYYVTILPAIGDPTTVKNMFMQEQASCE